MFDPDAHMPRINRGIVYLGACLIAGIRLARERQVNVRVVPTLKRQPGSGRPHATNFKLSQAVRASSPTTRPRMTSKRHGGDGFSNTPRRREPSSSTGVASLHRRNPDIRFS